MKKIVSLILQSETPINLDFFLLIMATTFISGCPADKCVDGSILNTEVCEARCKNAKTRASCDEASYNLGGLPDGWADFDHECKWVTYHQVNTNPDEGCQFGKQLGRCEYATGEGEDYYFHPPVLCDSKVIPDVIMYSEQIGGETYLTLQEGVIDSGTMLWCDKNSSLYSPLCKCPCQADSPFAAKPIHSYELPWRNTDNSCEGCAVTAENYECAYFFDPCYWEGGQCGDLYESLSEECGDTLTGSTDWLECYAHLIETVYSENSLLYQNLFLCAYCGVCADRCPQAAPACELWRPN